MMKAMKRHCKLTQLGGALTLGLGGALVAGMGEAQAADEIVLIYNTQTFTIESSEIRRFAETGEVPDDLQVFFDDVDQVPGVVRSLLIDDIRIPRVVEEFLDSPTGEFVLIQLDQVISNPQQSGDLASIRSAVSVAGRDREISVIELLNAYPTEQVSVDISNLDEVYTQVSAFVERIEPAIATAVEFLQDIVCDCEESVSAEGVEASEPEAVPEPVDEIDAEEIEGEEAEADETSAVPTTGTLVAHPNGEPCNPAIEARMADELNLHEDAVQASAPNQD